MKELYEKLYTDADTVYRYDKQRVGLGELSHFVAMKGCKFDQDDVRLFVIGRARNGGIQLERKNNSSCDCLPPGNAE